MSKDWRSFLYGGLASMLAEFVTFPMDTTKTRLQIQGQTQSLDIPSKNRKLKYRGMIHSLITIYREEGARALYSGVKPALLRQATYGSLKFGIYQTFKRLMNDHGALIDPVSGRERVLSNVICAGSAGAISSSIANPTDVLKVRLQQNPDNDQRLLRAFLKMYRSEGVSGLWRGVSGTAQRAAFLTSVSLPTYDFCKFHLRKYIDDGSFNHFLSAAIASLMGTVVSTPFDVLRTRVMEQTITPNVDPSKIYKGILDCFIKTVRTEGLLALYKGLVPIYFRMGPWNVTFFVTYEQMQKLY